MSNRGIIKVLIVWLVLLTLAFVISVNELFSKCEALFFTNARQQRQIKKLQDSLNEY